MFNEEMKPDKWYDSLIWCPSQCFMHKQKNGVDYVLYLRWRWDDPWQGHIITGAKSDRFPSDAEWSSDLFEDEGLYFEQHDYAAAKKKLEEMFNEEQA